MFPVVCGLVSVMTASFSAVGSGQLVTYEATMAMMEVAGDGKPTPRGDRPIAQVSKRFRLSGTGNPAFLADSGGKNFQGYGKFTTALGLPELASKIIPNPHC